KLLNDSPENSQESKAGRPSGRATRLVSHAPHPYLAVVHGRPAVGRRRVGEADFGVFLAGASEQDAEEIGNRIVSAVSAVYFTPAERSEPLVVRVGGVLYERQVEFDALFRAAAGQVDLAGVGGASSFRLVPLAADISGDGARPTA
ncbi:MAG: hypothetical protein J0J15_33865, partial [Mesorhizobium sp.]|nr:hypothetical protein [Mesorhizobium sp.]